MTNPLHLQVFMSKAIFTRQKARNLLFGAFIKCKLRFLGPPNKGRSPCMRPTQCRRCSSLLTFSTLRRSSPRGPGRVLSISLIQTCSPVLPQLCQSVSWPAAPLPIAVLGSPHSSSEAPQTWPAALSAHPVLTADTDQPMPLDSATLGPITNSAIIPSAIPVPGSFLTGGSQSWGIL